MLRPGTISKIGEHFENSPFSDEMENAFLEFFPKAKGTSPKNPFELREEDEGTFNEWLIFDFKLSNGETPLLYFVRTGMNGFSEDEKAIYRALTKTTYGVFEIIAVKIGKEMMVRQVGDEQIYNVKECMGTIGARKGMYIIARLCFMINQYEFVGSSIHALPFSIDKRTENGFADFAKDLNPKKAQEIFERTEHFENRETVKSYVEELPSPKDAEALLRKAFKKYGVDRYVTVEQIRAWANSVGVHDEYYQARINLIFGLLEDREMEDVESQNAFDEILPAINSFHNSLPIKSLGGKSPNEARAEQKRKNEEPDFSLSITKQGEWNSFYNKGISAFQKDNIAEALENFEKTFKGLLEERTTFREAFRVFGNAGVSNLVLGNEYAGRRFLEMALDLNSHYDFAENQLARYKAGEYNDAICQALYERIDDEEAKKNKSRKKLHNLRISVLAKLFEIDMRKKKRRRTSMHVADKAEIKEFESGFGYEYFNFLKRFGIDFNHPLSEPTTLTMLRKGGGKIGGNEICPCGSGKKYKKCHGG
jgi:hypothetical protein